VLGFANKNDPERAELNANSEEKRCGGKGGASSSTLERADAHRIQSHQTALPRPPIDAVA